MATKAARCTLPTPVPDIPWLAIPAIALRKSGLLGPRTLLSLLAEFSVYSQQWHGTDSRVSNIDRCRLSEIERDPEAVRADRIAGALDGSLCDGGNFARGRPVVDREQFSCGGVSESEELVAALKVRAKGRTRSGGSNGRSTHYDYAGC